MMLMLKQSLTLWNQPSWKDLAFRIELARKEEEERLRKEAEELERKRKEEEEMKRIEEELKHKRLEEERIERERLEAQAREKARIAAEQARFEDLTRNAPEFALIMRQRQENMESKIDKHEALLTSIFQILNERLPPPPQPPQP
jgi:hypothetical protein